MRGRLDGLLQGNHLGLVPGPGSEPGEARATSPATTCAGWTGRSPPAPRCRTSARPSPTASWRRGSSGPVAQPGLRHGGVREARPRRRRAGRRDPPDRRRRQPDRCAGQHRRHDDADPGPRGPDPRPWHCCARRPGPRAPRWAPAATSPRPSRGCAGRRGGGAGGGRLRLPRRAEWERALRALSARHELLAIEVLDPRELELPEVGTVVLADPETGRQREVVTRRCCAGSSPRPRRRTATGWRRRCAAAGRRTCGCAPTRDWVADVVRFVRRATRTVVGRG